MQPNEIFLFQLKDNSFRISSFRVLLPLWVFAWGLRSKRPQCVPITNFWTILISYKREGNPLLKVWLYLISLIPSSGLLSSKFWHQQDLAKAMKKGLPHLSSLNEGIFLIAPKRQQIEVIWMVSWKWHLLRKLDLPLRMRRRWEMDRRDWSLARMQYQKETEFVDVESRVYDFCVGYLWGPRSWSKEVGINAQQLHHKIKGITKGMLTTKDLIVHFLAQHQTESCNPTVELESQK